MSKFLLIIILSMTFLAGCGDQNALEKANQKIAGLEKKLKEEKAKSKNHDLHEKVVAKQETIEKKPKEPVLTSQWIYNHSEDKMSGKLTYTASVTSTNEIEFRAPYGHPQKARLTLRTSPRFGKDAYFQIQRGQILCSSYDGCLVLVRFDDGKASKYSALTPSDNSSETIFISNRSRFVKSLLKAKRVRISPEIYQNGSPVFEFDVSNFEQNKYKPKPKE